VSEQSLVGKTGSITGRVAPNATGEVLVNVRGGTESYFARAADGTEVIERGTQVLIVNTAPGRVLYVTALEVV
jgi:hypothetical protein